MSRFKAPTGPLAFALVLFLGGVQPALAQGVLLDEGTFRILIEGREVGTESFDIRRAEPDAEMQIIARGEIRMNLSDGRVDLQPLLRTGGSDMGVTAYRLQISGHTSEQIDVRIEDRRFTTTVRSEVGERQQQSRATPGTLLLETGVAHQYYMLAARVGSQGGTVPIIVPREGAQFDLTVTIVGTESVQIGGESLSARHLRLEGRGETRELWVDNEGRVLRLEFPAGGYVAVRTARP
jgi:hypothetical protein